MAFEMALRASSPASAMIATRTRVRSRDFGATVTPSGLTVSTVPGVDGRAGVKVAGKVAGGGPDAAAGGAGAADGGVSGTGPAGVSGVAGGQTTGFGQTGVCGSSTWPGATGIDAGAFGSSSS